MHKYWSWLGALRLAVLLHLPIYNLRAEVPRQAAASPAWVDGAIVYSLFLRDFSEEGDFKSATKRLDDLKNLGVTVVWLLPIHPTGRVMKKGMLGSPYCIENYYAVNSEYGSKGDFKRFVSRAHQLGLKVIIDAVLNHTSWDNKLISRPEFYRRDERNRIMSPIPDWHDVAALDYKNPSLRTYITQMLEYWLKEFDLDGFRFDAAHLVPLSFWEELRLELHTVKPDILLLGEEDAPEAMEKAFDLDYSWKLEEALSNVILNGAPATTAIKSVLEYEKKVFPQGAKHLRFSDNHDKKRAIVRFGEKAALAASALIFTQDGVPLLYNGMEVGDTTESSDPALFEKLPIFWKTSEMRPEFLYFYQHMIALRKKHAALRGSEVVWVGNSDESRVITYLKRGEGEEFLIAINLSNNLFMGRLELDDEVLPVDVTPVLGASQGQVLKSFSSISLNPWEFRIYSIPQRQ